jgi:hypothetical protein
MFQQKQMYQMQQMIQPLNQQTMNRIPINVRSTSPTSPFQKPKPVQNQMNQ